MADSVFVGLCGMGSVLGMLVQAMLFMPWILLLVLVLQRMINKTTIENPQDTYDNQSKVEEQRQQEEQRQAFLSQILTSEAKERLMKVKTVKPEKATAIENSLIKTYQSGTLKTRLTETDLVSLLERDSQARGEPKITFKRHGIDDEY